MTGWPQDLGILDYLGEVMWRNHPKLMTACGPRRYIPPAGYLNPRYMTSLLGAYIVNDPDELAKRRGAPGVSNQIMASQLIDYSVPTYFVGREFIRAVAATKPPENYTLGDLKWPLEAMLLVLPVDFMLEYTGRFVPFLTLCRLKVGTYDGPKNVEVNNVRRIKNEHDRAVFVFPAIMGNVPVDYSSSYTMKHTIAELSDSQEFLDFSYADEVKFNALNQLVRDAKNQRNNEILDAFRKDDIENPGKPGKPPPTVEEDIAFNNKMNALAIRLLLVMSARDNLMEPGECVRKERRNKKGRLEKEALWNPNMLGGRYRIKRETHSTGTGTSPRMHWRAGHMRNQACGLGLLEHRLIWIEGMLINADDE